jgi:hypothetical protein
MYRRIILTIFAIVMVMSAMSSCTVLMNIAGKLIVNVDGRPQTFSPAAKLTDGVVLAPLKGITEITESSFSVSGNKIAVFDREYTFNMAVGSKIATVVNGKVNKKLTLTAAPYKDGDVIFIPVKSLCDAFGYKYTYNQQENCAVVSTKVRKEYWFKYPTMAEQSLSDSTNVRISRGGYASEFSWGILAQMKSYEDEKSDEDAKHAKGIMTAGYFGAGAGGGWLIGYKTPVSSGLNTLYDVNAWAISFGSFDSSIKYVAFSGIHNEINNEPTVTGIGATREKLGYSEPKYPDGRSALGYDDKSPYPWPVNARVYDNAMSRGINGDLSVNFNFIFDDKPQYNMLSKIKVGDPGLRTYEGRNAGETVRFGGFAYSKDPAFPFWKEHARVAATEMVKTGLDGSWHDNSSPWFNFSGMGNAFGLWSEYTFNQWLSKYSAEELKKMGIPDIKKFNIREYMISKATQMGAVDAKNVNDSVYNSLSWLDDPIWCAYKVHKSNVGHDYLQTEYNIFKEVYELNNSKNGYCVMTNDMPAINHGWITDGCIDLNSSEINMGYNLTFGSRGVMTPPKGKLAVFYKVARETCQSPYMTPWVYSDEEVKGKVNVGKVYSCEAFINNAFIKAADNTVGTVESQKWINTYAYKVEPNLLGRYDAYDVAILQSPAEQLGNMVPDSLMGADGDNQLHMQGMWGWSAALTDAHVPYRVIPLWKFNSQTIKNVKTLILPNLECLDDYILTILQEYVTNGGRLVITGPSGKRYGTDGIFKIRSKGLLNNLVGRDITGAVGMTSNGAGDNSIKVYTNNIGKGTVLWYAAPVGFYYWNNDSERPARLPALMEMVGNTKTLFNGSALPLTVGSTVWYSADGKDTFVDLCNYNVDVTSDKVTPTESLSFSVKLPDNIDSSKLKAYLMTPDTKDILSEIKMTVTDGWAKFELLPMTYMDNIKITANSVLLAQGVPVQPSKKNVTH